MNAQKKWTDKDYVIRPTLSFDEAGHCIVTVTHREGLGRLYPGGGNSIRLTIDASQGKVIKDLRCQ